MEPYKQEGLTAQGKAVETIKKIADIEVSQYPVDIEITDGDNIRYVKKNKDIPTGWQKTGKYHYRYNGKVILTNSVRNDANGYNPDGDFPVLAAPIGTYVDTVGRLFFDKESDLYDADGNLKNDEELEELISMELGGIFTIQGLKNLIKDYKQLSQIEIEIIPLKDKYGKFIYILNENDESYYHIYFNDSDKETKNHYISEKDQVKKIKIIIDNKVKSLYKLFYSCNCIETITFQNYDRNNIEDMSCMFMCCSAKEVNFSVFNTENVKNMSYMFDECTSLKKIDLSNFNTKNVTNMREMFYDCTSIEEINLSNLNNKKLTNITSMFDKCASLKKIDFSNFTTENVANMNSLFRNCSKLKELDLSSFYTDSVETMINMFYQCSSLKKLIITNFNTSKTTNMRNMFYKCSSLESINVSNFNTENVKDMQNMFAYCSSLKDIDISNFALKEDTYISDMFIGCSDLLKEKVKSQNKNLKNEAFDDEMFD